MKIGSIDFYEGEFFKVVDMNGRGGIITNPDDEKSVEGCRAAIDRRNAWAQGNAAAYDVGCKPQQYLIVKHIWNRCFYPDGTFMEENTKVKTVEVYPAEV